jgi:flagellar basal-body rod protein FlgF
MERRGTACSPAKGSPNGGPVARNRPGRRGTGTAFVVCPAVSYGLQISASGVAAALYRQDVFANNLANIDTAGFKPDVPSARPRQAVREEDGVFDLPSNALLERLGGGVLLNANRVSMKQGALRQTGGPLDVGFQGRGFLVVGGAADQGEVLLTRDGRLARSAEGVLVLASSGAAVLDDSGSEIRLAATGPVTIDGDGTVVQNGAPLGRLGLVDVPPGVALTKLGQSLFRAGVPADSLTPAAGRLSQGAYEESASDEVASLMQVTAAGREVETNLAAMMQHDRLMDRAINTVGRVT